MKYAVELLPISIFAVRQGQQSQTAYRDIGLQRTQASNDPDMPEYIDPDVRDLRDSNSEEEITLLLGVSGDPDGFAKRVERLDATVEGKIGHATVRVTGSKSVIDALCELKGLKSIEIDRDDIQVLDRGNEQSRPRLTR